MAQDGEARVLSPEQALATDAEAVLLDIFLELAQRALNGLDQI